MKSRTSGFTLIELLTVIAIIGILAAILIPVTAKVRDQARTAACKSNQRQSVLALLIMANDNEGKLEMFRQGTGNGRWAQLLLSRGYLDSGAREAVFCPTWEPSDHFIPAWNFRTYGFNLIDSEYTTVYRGDGPEMLILNTNAVSESSRYFLIADSYHPGNKNQRFRISGYSASALDGLHLRHQGKANIAFLDGHVELPDMLRLAQIGFRSAYDENGQTVNIPPPPR